MTPTRFPDRLRAAAQAGATTSPLRRVRSRLVRPAGEKGAAGMAALPPEPAPASGEQFASRLRAALPEQPRVRG